MTTKDEDLSALDNETLKRKADEEWQMFALAQRDYDNAAAKHHAAKARRYEEALRQRRA